jgi:deoxycytidine triphosphate deaminase
MPVLDFANTHEDAERKYVKYRDLDPFPQIPPALLTSADIMDYVAATGMLHPFNPESGKLKPASYEADVLGTVQYWDADGHRVVDQLRRGASFTLKQNSIAFVEVEQRFRLPHYIAARFNLRIKHVYRGLLLGTGPLVDPGFRGRLFIPLHNLTNNDYEIAGGEGLLWVEFTKLSWTGETLSPALMRAGEFHPFEQGKQEQDLSYYLQKAAGGKPIRSSVPIEISKSTKAAEAAQTSSKIAQSAAESAKATTTRLGWSVLISVIALTVTLCALMVAILNFVSGVQRDLDSRVRSLERKAPSAPTSPPAATAPMTSPLPAAASPGGSASLPAMPSPLAVPPQDTASNGTEQKAREDLGPTKPDGQ